MAETKTIRINKVLREFNISLDRAVEFLGSKGFDVEASPNAKISDEEYKVLFNEFQTDKSKKVEAKEVGEEKRKEKEELRLERERELEEKQAPVEPKIIKAEAKLEGPKKLGKIDLDQTKPKRRKQLLKKNLLKPKKKHLQKKLPRKRRSWLKSLFPKRLKRRSHPNPKKPPRQFLKLLQRPKRLLPNTRNWRALTLPARKLI